MIGRIVYRLRAVGAARLPLFHGRWMHGAFFHLLGTAAPALAAELHDRSGRKPFAVSLLEREQGQRPSGKRLEVREGDMFLWRVSALRDNVGEALVSVTPGTVLQAGEALFCVEDVMADGSCGSGWMEPKEWLLQAQKACSARQVTFRFDSPASFRQDDRDYPMPLPEYIFSSLADKWADAGMPQAIRKDEVRAWAGTVQILEWQGKSRAVYFAKDRGMLSFQGVFSYGLQTLPEEQRRTLALLAQFAELSGVGRLTAQGFGQCRISLQG